MLTGVQVEAGASRGDSRAFDLAARSRKLRPGCCCDPTLCSVSKTSNRRYKAPPGPARVRGSFCNLCGAIASQVMAGSASTGVSSHGSLNKLCDILSHRKWPSCPSPHPRSTVSWLPCTYTHSPEQTMLAHAEITRVHRGEAQHAVRHRGRSKRMRKNIWGGSVSINIQDIIDTLPYISRYTTHNLDTLLI